MKRSKSRPKDPAFTRADALKCIPVKNLHVKEMHLESGEVRLQYPARVRPVIAGLLRWFGGGGDRTFVKKLELDALGTDVWRLIDGKRRVSEIAACLVAAHQLHPREAEVSVTLFLRELGKRGIIGLK